MQGLVCFLTRAFIVPGGRDAAPLCGCAREPGVRPCADRQQRAHQRYRQGKGSFRKKFEFTFTIKYTKVWVTTPECDYY